MNLLFTTSWGALYLGVLLVLMLPMLWRPERRWMAMGMIGLWFCDRLAVNTLPPDLSLFFLAFAYALVALAVVVTHRGGISRIVAGAMSVTSMTFIIGGFGVFDWDTTGTIQEISGAVAMVAIFFFGGHNGSRRAVPMDDGPVHGQRGVSAGAHARQQARK